MKRKVVELRRAELVKAEALIAKVSEPGNGDVFELTEMLAAFPMLLESALGYLLSEFDYEANPQSNTAIAVRLLAAGADRFKRLQQTALC